MFFFPFRAATRSRYGVARDLFAAATTASRRPFFFRNLGVPDTLEGRADVVSIHTGLLICRLCRLDADDNAEKRHEGAKLAQAIFDEMFWSYDWALREMGVGDLSVPRHIRRMMSSFKGQAVAYDEAARAGVSEVKAALLRNVFADTPPPSMAALSTFAAYVREAYCALGRQGLSDLSRGRVHFGEIEHEAWQTDRQAACA